MLRDITIGQHFPGNSLVHRFDPRLKLVLTILYIVLLFAASNPLGLALSLIFLAAMYAVAKIPFKLILKSLKPIFPIIVFTAVLNLFFVSGEGDPVFKLGFLTVYAEGIRYAVLMAYFKAFRDCTGRCVCRDDGDRGDDCGCITSAAYLGKTGGKPGNEFEPHLSGKQCFKGILQRKIVCRGGAGTTGSDC